MTTDHERCEHNEREIAYLRDLFEAEIKRMDSLLFEREKAGEKVEAEALRARQAANEWRLAMSDREHRFATVASIDTVKEELGLVRGALSEWQGRRVAWIAAAGIIATLLAIGVGQIIRQGITAADVSSQIQREAPWNRDKAGVERSITVLEKRQEQVRIELSRLEQRIDSICLEHKPQVC